jgi:ribosomal protein S18 acetylase RimI-like enzyme
MSATLSLADITIRTTLEAGDIGYLTYLHGILYRAEYNYGLSFEAYVAAGLHEFVTHYNPARSRVWVCEHENKMVGFLALMDRGESAQLRYFLIHPACRGLGLGRKLMALFADFLRSSGYQSAYLWTTEEQLTAIKLYQRHGFRLSEEKASTAFGKPLYEQRYDLVLSQQG